YAGTRFVNRGFAPVVARKRHRCGRRIYATTPRGPHTFNAFCVDLLNPFLNMHRPCLFGTEVPDPKKPGRTRRVHRPQDVMTPLEKLASLPDADDFLRKGITLDQLKQQARSQTNIESARQVRQARERLMGKVADQNRPRYPDVWSLARARGT
ncbi:hypothetical protein, partial [Burkholderia cepacia]